LSSFLTRGPSPLSGGILWMLLGVALFAMNDALGKWLVAEYVVGQILAIRSFAALLVLAPVVWRAGVAALRLEEPLWHAVRIALVVAEVALFYWSVRDLPLADVMAIYLASPLFVAAFSAAFLGERVGRRRLAAILVGFAGVVVVLRPSAAIVSLPALAALGGSLVYALMMLITRRLRATPGLALITTQTAGVGLAGLATLPFGWSAPAGFDLALIGLLGIVAMLGHFSVNRAVALSPASVVVPFQYTSILWGIALGLAIWGDRPQPLALIGAALIVASGLVLLREERAGAAAAAPALPAPPQRGRRTS
jgi:drug/metabolite transporter (DMT)-like permease